MNQTPLTPPVTRSTTVFRVTGIPLATTLDHLITILTTEFSSETDIRPDIDNCSLSPSCYDERNQTALIQFTPRAPRPLESLANNDDYLIDIGSGYDIAIDQDFYGLTQLYPTTEPITADVVAVCGLNGHAYGSWAGKADHRGLKRMWLRHFLQRDMPGCRVMVYGYNSRLTGQWTHAIPDYTDLFLEELKKARRRDEEKERPIVFIGHSFGGIIAAQSIVKAKDNPLKHGPLFMSTKAAIFFGTPHRGLVVDDLLAMIGEGSTREDLIKSLEVGSQELKRELSRFIHALTVNKMKIVTFKEIGQTRRLVKDENGTWARTGSFFNAVENSSSILGLPDSIEETLAIEGDHSTLVKFTHRSHQSYTSVIRHLEALTQDTGAGRFLTPGSAVVNGTTYDLTRVLHSTTVDLNKPFKYLGLETTLLHVSIQNDDISNVRLLLQRAVNVEARNGGGLTALQAAAHTGRDYIVELLLQNGALVQPLKDGLGPGALGLLSALHIASLFGNANTVQALLNGGASVSDRGGPFKYNALHFAAANPDETVADLLLRSGSDIAVKSTGDFAALHIAAGAGNVEVIRSLLAQGADIKAKECDGNNALHWATSYGRLGAVEVLLENGADVRAQNSIGQTALHLACGGSNMELIDMLLKHGADIRAKDFTGITILHHASAKSTEGTVAMLLRRGMDIEERCMAGKTALHYAATNTDETVTALLLDNKANMVAKASTSMTPLYVAVREGNFKVIDLLLKSRVDINAVAGAYGTPLHAACQLGREDIVEHLLDKGAQINKRCFGRITGLHVATLHGRDNVVKLLVARGANIQARDIFFNRAVDKAVKFNHDNCVKILKNAAKK